MALTAREIVAGTVQVASPPEIFARINTMVDSPRHSASDIGRVLGKDPALTARLLKIVNSPFYGFPSRIDTVSRAITVIGVRELRDLVLATTVARLFAGLPNDLVSMQQFWQHSTYCALIARLLAGRRRELNVERFFVAGLLHDIGNLLLYRKIPELAREALLRAHHNDAVLEEAERDIIGFTHADVGAELMRKWRLPKGIEEAAKFHHRPAGGQPMSMEAAIVHLADQIAYALFDNAEEAIPPLDTLAWDLVGLAAEDVEPVVTEAERQFAEVFALVHGAQQGAAAG